MQRRIDPALRLGVAEAGGKEETGEEKSGQILHGRRIPNGGVRYSVFMLREVIKIIVVESKNVNRPPRARRHWSPERRTMDCVGMPIKVSVSQGVIDDNWGGEKGNATWRKS
jgi:hypothetical protein